MLFGEIVSLSAVSGQKAFCRSLKSPVMNTGRPVLRSSMILARSILIALARQPAALPRTLAGLCTLRKYAVRPVDFSRSSTAGTCRVLPLK